MLGVQASLSPAGFNGGVDGFRGGQPLQERAVTQFQGYYNCGCKRLSPGHPIVCEHGFFTFHLQI